MSADNQIIIEPFGQKWEVRMIDCSSGNRIGKAERYKHKDDAIARAIQMHNEGPVEYGITVRTVRGKLRIGDWVVAMQDRYHDNDIEFYAVRTYGQIVGMKPRPRKSYLYLVKIADGREVGYARDEIEPVSLMFPPEVVAQIESGTYPEVGWDDVIRV